MANIESYQEARRADFRNAAKSSLRAHNRLLGKTLLREEGLPEVSPREKTKAEVAFNEADRELYFRWLAASIVDGFFKGSQYRKIPFPDRKK